MTMPTSEILQSLLAALRATGLFSEVMLGSPSPSAAVPHAAILFQELQSLPCDDSASAQWMRLTAQGTIATQDNSQADGTTRLLALFDAARQALLNDRFRGGLCCDLPAGNATEISPAQLDKTVRLPSMRLTFALRCHFEV